MNDKQERFCKEYVIDCNASAAYVRAGYSAKGANKLSARLMANGGISARIAELMDEKDASLIAKADEVLQTLTRILRREEMEQVPMKISDRVPTVDDSGKTRYETRERIEIVSIRPGVSDVNRAAELLGKRYGLYKDVVDVDGALPVIVDNVPLENKPPCEIQREDGGP